MKRFLIITLFPEMFTGVLNTSMLWKAKKDGLASFDLINLRDYGVGVRQQVDDSPYGGGPGMVLMVEPLARAITAARAKLPNAKVILMAPSKMVWSQALAKEFSSSDSDYILICGHYEGYDARIEILVDHKISIGRFVLTGGELPAMTVIDSIVRLLPGVLGGGQEAVEIESYSENTLLEYPQYTRPAEFNGQKVPDVLLSGNHQAIKQWREQHSFKK